MATLSELIKNQSKGGNIQSPVNNTGLNLSTPQPTQQVQPMQPRPSLSDMIRQSQQEKQPQQVATPGRVLEQPVEEQQKPGLLSKAGKFFTGNTQKFAKTLGTAASVVDPRTKQMRQEAIDSTNKMVDDMLIRARQESDKAKANRILELAQNLADTENIDIFNRPEYQKTAKQIYGEALGTGLETLAWGKVAGVAKGALATTARQTAWAGAKTGGILGTGFGTARAMQEDATMGEIAKTGILGGITGAVVGGALGFVSGKIAGRKVDKNTMAEYVSERLTSKVKTAAYKVGKIKSPTKFRGERFIPNKKDLEMAKIAENIKLTGRNFSKDITKVKNAIGKEAQKLKDRLIGSKAIYNQNIIKGKLNKMRSEKTADLIKAELRPYDNYINKFIQMVKTNKNKKLDGLLELRQKFDKWATSNNPRIFENQTGGAYRALKAVRDTINDYINTQIKDNFVKASLGKQHLMYDILENISEKAGKGIIKLQPAGITELGRKAVGMSAPWVKKAAIGGGLLAGYKAIKK